MTDQEAARAIVERWASEYETAYLPQFDFVQSEALQALIATAIATERARCAAVARDYKRDDPDRMCCMGRNKNIARAIEQMHDQHTKEPSR